jgi:micrococcal nuclease
METNNRKEEGMKKLFLLFLFSLYFTLFASEIVPVKVACVVDGDTIKVYWYGAKKSVRLIGVDTSETRRNPRIEKQKALLGKREEVIIELGKQAKEKLKEYIKPNQVVYLEFDIEKTDRYGRLLAYVWLDKDRKNMVNEIMVKEGYALACIYSPNTKYADRFIQAQKIARENKKELWKEE